MHMPPLTATQRAALPASDFALPATREYPIENRDHAEAALRDLHNASPADQKRIRAAIRQRYPELGNQTIRHRQAGGQFQPHPRHK